MAKKVWDKKICRYCNNWKEGVRRIRGILLCDYCMKDLMKMGKLKDFLNSSSNKEKKLENK